MVGIMLSLPRACVAAPNWERASSRKIDGVPAPRLYRRLWEKLLVPGASGVNEEVQASPSPAASLKRQDMPKPEIYRRHGQDGTGAIR